MLSRIQGLLTDLYDVPVAASVDDFVCDEDVARAAVGDAVQRGEVLMVAEEPDGVALGLYVHPSAVAALGAPGDPCATGERFEAWCLATEGVSHFLYIHFRVQNDEAVSQLELELQAEVDKYAAALLAGPELLRGNGVEAIRRRSRMLRRRLFQDVRFIDAGESPEGERYRVANRVAARYARHLEQRFVDPGALTALSAELRRFYRMGAGGKLAAGR